MPFSNEALSGDTLTTISLNYRWRELIVNAMEFYYLDRDESTIELDNQDKLTDFFLDLYDDD